MWVNGCYVRRQKKPGRGVPGVRRRQREKLEATANTKMKETLPSSLSADKKNFEGRI